MTLFPFGTFSFPIHYVVKNLIISPLDIHRRERNRMHAKRTRDRKKQLLEVSESIIGEMENESHSLREYLVSLKLISVEEAEKSEERACESKKERAALKVTIFSHFCNAFLDISFVTLSIRFLSVILF